MAKIKYTFAVADLRNKYNGSVFSKNRAGAYVRNKVTPVNPQTVSQIAVRSQFTSLSQAWRALTEAQRLSWASQVEGFKTTDIFGDLRTPSALNLYMRINGNLNAIGAATINTAPVPGATPSIDSMALVSDVSASTFTFDPGVLVVPAGTAWLVEATPGVSPGKNFVKSEYRVIAVLPATTVTPYNAWTEFVAKFGAPVAGQKVFVRVSPIATATGLRGQTISASAIVTA